MHVKKKEFEKNADDFMMAALSGDLDDEAFHAQEDDIHVQALWLIFRTGDEKSRRIAVKALRSSNLRRNRHCA